MFLTVAQCGGEMSRLTQMSTARTTGRGAIGPASISGTSICSLTRMAKVTLTARAFRI